MGCGGKEWVKTVWGSGPVRRGCSSFAGRLYFATYICRLNFSAVMPELNTLGLFTKAQMASVSSCFFITYGVGQFINGFLGDRIAPRQMVFGGLLVSSLCNLLLFFAHGYGVRCFFGG